MFNRGVCKVDQCSTMPWFCENQTVRAVVITFQYMATARHLVGTRGTKNKARVKKCQRYPGGKGRGMEGNLEKADDNSAQTLTIPPVGAAERPLHLPSWLDPPAPSAPFED